MLGKSALKRYNMGNEKDPKTWTVGFHRWRAFLCEVDVFLHHAVVLPIMNYLLACMVFFFLTFLVCKATVAQNKRQLWCRTWRKHFANTLLCYSFWPVSLGQAYRANLVSFKTPDMMDFTLFLDNSSLPVSHMETRKSLITLLFKRHHHKHLWKTPQSSILYICKHRLPPR